MTKENFRAKLDLAKKAQQQHASIGLDEFGFSWYLDKNGNPMPCGRCFDREREESVGPRCKKCKVRPARLVWGGSEYEWLKFCQPCVDQFKAERAGEL
jgi:hypothetical protein